MFSTAIIFDRRGQAADGKKEGNLEVRVTIDRKSYYISTGMRVLQKHWAGAVVVRPDADALNNRLGIIVRRVNEKMNEFIEKRKPIDVDAIKRYIYNGTKADNGGSMLEWMKKHPDTLLVVTADHQTGGLSITNANRKTGMVTGKFTTFRHSGVAVPVFAAGVGAERFTGVRENTALAPKIYQAAGMKP